MTGLGSSKGTWSLPRFGKACLSTFLPPPDPHSRCETLRLSPTVSIRNYRVVEVRLHRIFAGQGFNFPKAETRFVWTRLATPSSSPSSWWPMSHLKGTFQGQLFHRSFASANSYGPTMHRVLVRPVELPIFRSFTHSTDAPRDAQGAERLTSSSECFTTVSPMNLQVSRLPPPNRACDFHRTRLSRDWHFSTGLLPFCHPL